MVSQINLHRTPACQPKLLGEEGRPLIDLVCIGPMSCVAVQHGYFLAARFLVKVSRNDQPEPGLRRLAHCLLHSLFGIHQVEIKLILCGEAANNR